jgi:hypothetical protein|tara:strand:- start:235 stop:477 length:243 start_codon:yes stop_codon:yes gene_type:complete
LSDSNLKYAVGLGQFKKPVLITMFAVTQGRKKMDIKKAIDAAYLRGQVVALYKLKVNMQDTINKLEDQIKEGEKNEDNKL